MSRSYDRLMKENRRLEAELADLRQERDEIEMAREELAEQHYEMKAELEYWEKQARGWEHLYAQAQAELAEWEIHGVEVTEDCDYCSSNSLKRSDDCPDCGGTGKKPRDGVQPMIEGRYHVAEFPGVLIPAEWLEAE